MAKGKAITIFSSNMCEFLVYLKKNGVFIPFILYPQYFATVMCIQRNFCTVMLCLPLNLETISFRHYICSAA